MKKETPLEFITLHTEIGYQGRAFTVRKDTLKLPDGRETIYDIIDHPGAVTIIPVDTGWKYILCSTIPTSHR